MYVRQGTFGIRKKPGSLWLAAADGRRLPRPHATPDHATTTHPASHGALPERVMTVHFEGISETQQRAALAAFPGGRRFVLSS